MHSLSQVIGTALALVADAAPQSNGIVAGGDQPGLQPKDR
jgi:hypothetical protein